MPAAPLRASVVIPTLNRRALLLRTLESFAHQSIDPERFEMIIAVDGSTDGTVEALAELRTPYTLRWLVSERNRGTECNDLTFNPSTSIQTVVSHELEQVRYMGFIRLK